MIVKRKKETIKMNNGTHLHVFTEVVPKEELMQEMEIAEKHTRIIPALLTSLTICMQKVIIYLEKGMQRTPLSTWRANWI